MYTESIGTNNVPAFLSKLWRLVDSSHNNDLISWSSSGKSFIIRNQAQFAKELLPLYFKHNNMASFIRQLNMYGFRKITHIENTGLKVENDEIEFYHACFVKGQENMLEYIKRKNSLSVASAKSNCALEDKTNKEEVHLILNDVCGIKSKQENMDSLLSKMQNENEALWKEIANLRHKHQKQQQIVERLIHFLMSLVHSGGIGMKRKLPLMIDNRNGNKVADSVSSCTSNLNLLEANSGPIIQEITQGFLDNEYDEDLNSPIINAALSEPGEPVQQFEETNDNQKMFISQKDQLTVANTAESGEPVQQFEETNDDSSIFVCQKDQLTVPNAAESDEPVQQFEETNDNSPIFVSHKDQLKVPNTLSVENDLKLVMPQTTTPLNQNSFCNSTNNNLVASTSNFDTNVLNTPNITVSENFNNHFDSHCEGVDSELSSLQDQLLQGDFNIDANVLMGVRMDSNYITELFSHEPVDKAGQLTSINDTTTSSSVNSIKSNTVDQDLVNSNFELCDNLFDNQTDFLTGDTSISNKSLNDPTFSTDINSSGIFDTNDLLDTEDEINQFLNQASDEPDIFNKEKKKRRLT